MGWLISSLSIIELSSPTEKRKGGKKTWKKQRGKSFICSEKGEKNKESTEKRKGGKSREEIERKEFYMLQKCGR